MINNNKKNNKHHELSSSSTTTTTTTTTRSIYLGDEGVNFPSKQLPWVIGYQKIVPIRSTMFSYIYDFITFL